ncbi:DUF3015 family protein [Salinisphaera sp. Q1T1-3]|uniref:DUF3015 family protein n=1 Tax=Salinisphaera sp. Q1T1-3 TaxID=2321229 RepID=UPI001314D12F|nr:DUF3015 family protein [Salinisphaera sp. Q1T1-3]
MTITTRSHATSGRGAIGAGLALALCALTGCAATDVTTHRGMQATTASLKGTAYALRASGRASVTAPDTPRYAEATDFFESQRSQLARQAAAGGGEDIDALGLLLGKSDNRALARWMQAHYHALFSDRTVAASRVISRIDAQAG